jgi:hypothetical protein
MKVIRILAIGALLTWVVSSTRRALKKRNTHREEDSKLDTALDSTFPASDPTATQDFAIPVNRQ